MSTSFSSTEQTTISPSTLQPYPETHRVYPSTSDLDKIIETSASAQSLWAESSIEDRLAVGNGFAAGLKALIASPEQTAKELTLQMGRPVSQGVGELKGCLGRVEYLLSIARESLADVPLTDTDLPGFKRYIRRVPMGVVLVIAPWNFPYLVTINSLLPAILAGNSVILKPSPQTPLVAETFHKLFKDAGLPDGVFEVVHLSPKLTSQAISHPKISFISFTGSVANGAEVSKIAANAAGFKGVALELGGKDPAYVLPDCDLEYTVEQLVDGAMFNSGQSCCAIERIYVHESIYDKFVQQYADLVKTYKLGDPLDPSTNLGPVVSIASADRIRAQVEAAIKAGAKPLIPVSNFANVATSGSAFVAPQVLVDVHHSMEVMSEETFGPVVGIMKVSSDSEAIKLMNDSKYGLTASVWTTSAETFTRLEGKIEAGTVFMNRCDFLDPALAWTGVKDSGRGVSLSKFGFDQLTRAKSVHMKIKTN
ncbi:succinate semialdehyde dehydrogenase [Flagelloscypha sp. PMI_526]|nr:succinate semialdehyde dehydrogenase [Flagelloscypha sp. PMI_526]